MASRDDYTVGWICALPLEMAAAKSMLDNIHADLPTDPLSNDTNAYILGDLCRHNVVVACLPVGVYGTTSAAIVVTQMLATFRNIRLSLMVGIGGGVPNAKEDVRLGDIVVSKPTASRPGILQYDFGKECAENQLITTGALNKPSAMLLTAAGKVEANSILGESQIPSHLAHIIQKDPLVFSHPGQDQDVVYDSRYDHPSGGGPDATCSSSCDPSQIVYRKPRITNDPKVHYGLIASGNRVMRHGGTRDRLAKQYGILCFEMEAAGLMDIAQCLVIRGICDYSDSHKSKQWQGYAAAAAAAYAKEILSLIPPTPKPEPLATIADPIVASVLNAVLLTRPEVDRSSLIVLKGRRVDGTCEWLMDHPNYRAWLEGHKSSPLLWISGGPGKGKTMLSIYITEVLEQLQEGILLYYFCSGRNKNMNTALTLMRGILHQWITICPQYVQYIRSFFDGTETTKYTLSNLMCLWRVFSAMLTKSTPCPVTLVLDGLDECEEDGLRQLLDLLRELLSSAQGRVRVIILSRPQPGGPLDTGLHMFPRIKLDEETDTEVNKDVERYIEAKVAELASEKILSADKLDQIKQTLLNKADGTFLWVAFVANELKGKTWLKAQQVLYGIPKGLGGFYCRLLEQVVDKEILVPLLQWVVLAARPLTVTELAAAAQVEGSDTLSVTEVLKERLGSCGLLVKIYNGVVNLVHESAREFFQSDQVNRQGSSISIFYMNHKAHRNIMRTCLALIEGSYKSPGSISNASTRNSLLAYAGLYWPGHFKQSIDPNEAQMDDTLSLFFQSESAVREDWWNFYWQCIESGGTPPKFTLLHLAAYFGNLAWANMLLKTPKKKGVSKKDSYGRTPLFWAATRGHRDVVELLLDYGAPIDSKDQSKMTALHMAVTNEHKDVVELLIKRSSKLEEKAYYDETPLMRAIQADSKEIVTLLLENGARTDSLPIPPGFPRLLKSRHDPIEDRASELMTLKEALFAARYENQSKEVALAIKVFTHSLRFQPVFKAVSFYIRHHISPGRWETLQDLVKNNETARIKEWAISWINFGSQFIESRNHKSLANMTDLSIRVFEVVSRADLEALLVIGVMVGAGVMLNSAQAHWREGVEISAKTYSRFAFIARRNDAEEFLDYGSRQFLIDFDSCLRGGKMDESVARVEVLFNTYLAILADEQSWPIDYFSNFIREFFEGYIGGPYDELLFNAASQAFANELESISKAHATDGQQNEHQRLFFVLKALLQLAQGSPEKSQDWFLNLPPASCLILCQQQDDRNPALPHRWLISTGIPEILAELIPKQSCPAQKRALKAFIEYLIIAKQYDFIPSDSAQKVIKGHMMSIEGAEDMLERTINS
ncbi:hypothetical protein QBC38DRAFT_517311 [Podospora fimiseda]|uniref:Ankyrin repeat protein n=1 Tax=Podospora fimiseda TaxID=252190 RepID=A0AAN7GS40_9PEZI|nr:hypothetical protein QBC38DRAFT_517311 [Podospora fimiseda]